MRRQRLPLLAVITRVLVAAAILAVGVGINAWLSSAKREGEVGAAAAEKRQVPVFAAREAAVRRQWRGWGNVDPISSADVPAQIKAVVLYLPGPVEAGAPIRKGDVVIELESSDFERQVEIAEQALADLSAQLELLEVEQARLAEQLQLDRREVALARADLERRRELKVRGGATPKDIDDAMRLLLAAERNEVRTREGLDKLAPRRAQLQAQIVGQEASLQLARKNLERTRITSPIDGVLQAVDVEVGEEVQPGQRVARVVNLDRVEVPVRLPASARTDIALGNTVEIEATNQSGYRCTAEVKRIAPEDDPATRTATVYVEVEQAAAAAEFQSGARVLTPGTFVTGTLTSRREQMKWVIPRRAVRNGRIFVVRDGVVHSRPIESDFALEQAFDQTGLPDRQWIALKRTPGDLRPGDYIVVNANMALLDGEVVDPHLTGPRQAAQSLPRQEARP